MSRPSVQASSGPSDPVSTTILPASWYRDPAVHVREEETLFHRSWIHVGHASRIPAAGDYLTYDIGGQSIIVMRAGAGRMHAFYNVCRHRGSQLLTEEGTVARIYCPYHGWTYDLDGNLVAARRSEKIAGFDRSCWGLRAVRLERMAGFLFVCLDEEAPSMSEAYPGLDEKLHACEPEIEGLVHVHRMTYDIACNWKIAVENYMEGYHVRTVHPALYKGFDMGAFTWDINALYTNMRTVARQDADQQAYDWKDAARDDLPAIWMWPMVMFERMPGRAGLFTYNHLPMGPERTLQVVDFYFLQPELDEQDRQQIDYVDLVRREDLASLESVHRGIHSKGWGRGPLMMGPDAAPEWTEAGVLHFQNIVWQRMQAEG